MSLVSTLVYLSQSLRQLSNKVRNKAITAINKRIKDVEAEQVSVEEQRSANMIELHNHFYVSKAELARKKQAAIDTIIAKYSDDAGKLAASFEKHKKIIAVSSASASNVLKSELVALRTELDHLTR